MIDKDKILDAAKEVAERVLNNLDKQPAIFDHQIAQSLIDEVSIRGDKMQRETRDILITVVGVLIARERMAQESEKMGGNISSEGFGRVARGTAH